MCEEAEDFEYDRKMVLLRDERWLVVVNRFSPGLGFVVIVLIFILVRLLYSLLLLHMDPSLKSGTIVPSTSLS